MIFLGFIRALIVLPTNDVVVASLEAVFQLFPSRQPSLFQCVFLRSSTIKQQSHAIVIAHVPRVGYLPLLAIAIVVAAV